MEKTKKRIELNLDGRKFVQDTPTFEQEMYILEQANSAGLMSIEGGLQLGEDKNLHRSVQQMIITAYQSGALFRLMASLLTEEGKNWTRESADANAEYFKTIKSPESKKQLQPALVGAVLAFFESAAGSDLTSLISLDDEEDSPSGIKVIPRSGTQAAAAFFSGSTRSPSKKSVTTTRSPSKKSSLGKSGKVSSPLN